MINLIHIVDSLSIGGLENFVINLVNNLDSSKYNIHICCLNKPGELISKLNKNIKIHCLNKQPRIDYRLFLRLSKLLKKHRIDIVHTHNTNPYRYGTIAAKLAGVSKIFNTDHNSLAYLRGKKQFIFNYLLSFFNTKIITVSHDLAKKHIRLGNFSKHKIKTIHNGIPFQYKKINKTTKIKQLNKDIKAHQKNKLNPHLKNNQTSNQIHPNDTILIAIGRLSKEKDHFTLISAFNRLNQNNLKLLIVGDGPLKNKLQDFASNNNIIFLGSRNDISELLQISDIFVLSSLTEGISLTILEAMQHKVPIIATNVGGNKEILNLNSAILIPPKNPKLLSEKISFLLENKKISQHLADNAFKTLQNQFNFKDMINKYENLYQK